jgi:hypothetical protein
MKEEIKLWLTQNKENLNQEKSKLIKYWSGKLSLYKSRPKEFKALITTEEHIAFLALFKSRYAQIYKHIINEMMDNISDFYGGEETFETAYPYDIILSKNDSTYNWVLSFEVADSMEILHANFEGWNYTGINLSD